jgi:hypothetical protein
MTSDLRLRRGTDADADIAAEVYLRARHHAIPEIPPLAHPADEVRQWMRGVLAEQKVWLACADDGAPLGLMVWTATGSSSYMSTRPGRAAGSALVSSSWPSSDTRTGSSCGRSCRTCGRSASMSATASRSRSGPTAAVMRSTPPICAMSGALADETPAIASPDDTAISEGFAGAAGPRRQSRRHRRRLRALSPATPVASGDDSDVSAEAPCEALH